jgi:hypothetical protein
MNKFPFTAVIFTDAGAVDDTTLSGVGAMDEGAPTWASGVGMLGIVSSVGDG